MCAPHSFNGCTVANCFAVLCNIIYIYFFVYIVVKKERKGKRGKSALMECVYPYLPGDLPLLLLDDALRGEGELTRGILLLFLFFLLVCLKFAGFLNFLINFPRCFFIYL